MKINRKQFADLGPIQSIDDDTWRMASACWNAVTIWEMLGDPEHWAWKYDFLDEEDEVARFDRAIDEMAKHQKAFDKGYKTVKAHLAALDKALA